MMITKIKGPRPTEPEVSPFARRCSLPNHIRGSSADLFLGLSGQATVALAKGI